MVTPVSVSIVVAVVVLALAGMLWSWRRRGAAQRGLRLPQGEGGGPERAEASGTYLATTFGGRPLERVSGAGLGFRARCRLAVTDHGLLVELAGAQPFTVPAAVITGAGTGTWALDRAVEQGGLLIVAWALEDAGTAVPVESAFRLDAHGQAAVLAALHELVQSAVQDAADHPTPGGA